MSRSCCNGSDLNSANANDLSSDPTPFLNPNERKQAKTNKGSSLREVGMSRPFGIDIEHPCSLNVSAASTHDTTRPGKFESTICYMILFCYVLKNCTSPVSLDFITFFCIGN